MINLISIVVALILATTSFALSILVLMRILRVEKLLLFIGSRAIERVARRRLKLVKRYILFEVHGFEGSAEELINIINRALGREIGRIGAAQCNVRLVLFSPTSLRGVLRIRGPYICMHQVLLALTTIRDFNGKKFIIVPLRASGSLKKLRKLFS